MDSSRGVVVHSTVKSSGAASYINGKLRHLAVDGRNKARTEDVRSSRALTWCLAHSSAEVDVNGREEAAAASVTGSLSAVTPGERRMSYVFHYTSHHSTRKGFKTRNRRADTKAETCDYSSEGIHSDCTHTRANSAHVDDGNRTSYTPRTSSPVTRSHSQRNLVRLLKSIRPVGITRNVSLYSTAENDLSIPPLGSEQENTASAPSLGHHPLDGPRVGARVLTRQRCLLLLDKLVLMLSFVAIAACWGIIDVGVELLAHGELRLEIAYYSVLLLVSLGLINAAKHIRPCEIAFAASVTLSFLSAVAGWGLVDTIVEYAAGARASIKIVYYGSFLFCAVACVLLYIYLLNPSFRLSAACFA